MIARQSRLVDPDWLSIKSNSSSQSNAEIWACSGPNNCFTALMNDESSRSAICVCSLQIELENDSFVFIGSLCVSAALGIRSGTVIPKCTRFLIDTDSVHKRDHTRDANTKQLDDGVDHNFVSAGKK